MNPEKKDFFLRVEKYINDYRIARLPYNQEIENRIDELTSLMKLEAVDDDDGYMEEIRLLFKNLKQFIRYNI